MNIGEKKCICDNCKAKINEVTDGRTDYNYECGAYNDDDYYDFDVDDIGWLKDEIEISTRIIKNLGWKVKFFYQRDKKERPKCTICKLYEKNSDITYIGVSRCRKGDILLKVAGRYIALDRAFKAVKTKNSENFPDSFFYKYATIKVGEQINNSVNEIIINHV